MAVRRQAILQEPCRYYAPMQNSLVCSYSEMQQETRNKDGDGEKRRGGIGRDVIVENKQSSMERGAFVMTDSANFRCGGLISTPFQVDEIYI